MWIRLFNRLRPAVAALLVLAAGILCLEFWLRGQPRASLRIITPAASLEDQALLIASPACHHDLAKQSSSVDNPSGVSPIVSIRVNSFGCRGADPDEAAVRRILLLGDESIFGSGVAETETVAIRLTQFLAKQKMTSISVMNGGVPGYCPLLSWLRFDDHLKDFNPDLVLLHVDMSDIADDVSFRSLLTADGNRVVCPHPSLQLPASSASFLPLVTQSASATWLFAASRKHLPELLALPTADAASEIGYRWITDDPPDLRLQIRHALQPVQQLQDAVSRSGGRLLVTTAPVIWQIVSGQEVPELSQQYGLASTAPLQSRFPFEVLAAFCRQADIPFLDTSPAFQRPDAAKLFSPTAPILSRVGMALYAHQMAAYLREHPDLLRSSGDPGRMSHSDSEPAN